MKEIKLWEIVPEGKNGLDVKKIEDVSETETENQLEEVITKCPELLMRELKLVGRQTKIHLVALLTCLVWMVMDA